jgi:hypothetical protein
MSDKNKITEEDLEGRSNKQQVEPLNRHSLYRKTDFLP